jgi:5-methylthioribose kinase
MDSVPVAELRTDPNTVARYAVSRYSDIGAVVGVDRITTGFLNFVWRVRGTGGSVIVKVMAEFAASNPTIALDRRRVAVEAAALELLAPGGRLGSVCGSMVHTPRLLDGDPERGVLIIEDFGSIPDLKSWLGTTNDSRLAGNIGQEIGGFLGRLHLHSNEDPEIASRVENPTIQKTRLEVQYRAVSQLAAQASLGDASKIGAKAEALGHSLNRRGHVFIMGDLWPQSLLISRQQVGVIDWELAHWGWPAQDVAHLAAHLWMIEQTAAEDDAKERARRTRVEFLVGYREALGSRFDELFGTTGVEHSRIHAGAEILVRTLGRFSDGYLYGGLDPDSTLVKEAVTVAAEHIRSDPSSDMFAPLLE